LIKRFPHGIAVVIDSMKERPDGGLIDIDATIICERDSHKGIMHRKAGRHAEEDRYSCEIWK